MVQRYRGWTKVHLIFEPQGPEACEGFRFHSWSPFVAEDGNQGLPDWFFEWALTAEPYVNITWDQETDECEWVPPVGPAPVWKEKRAGRSEADLFAAFDEWFRRTY